MYRTYFFNGREISFKLNVVSIRQYVISDAANVLMLMFQGNQPTNDLYCLCISRLQIILKSEKDTITPL